MYLCCHRKSRSVYFNRSALPGCPVWSLYSSLYFTEHLAMSPCLFSMVKSGSKPVWQMLTEPCSSRTDAHHQTCPRPGGGRGGRRGLCMMQCCGVTAWHGPLVLPEELVLSGGLRCQLMCLMIRGVWWCYLQGSRGGVVHLDQTHLRCMFPDSLNASRLIQDRWR